MAVRTTRISILLAAKDSSSTEIQILFCDQTRAGIWQFHGAWVRKTALIVVHLKVANTVHLIDPGCDDWASPTLLAVSITVGILLLIVVLIYVKAKVGYIRRTNGLVSKSLLIAGAFLSVLLTVYIISTDVVYVCDVRTIDFLINISNGIYFSILVGYLISLLIIYPRLPSDLGKALAPSIFVAVQIIIAAVAHFSMVEEQGIRTSVHFCYDERKKSSVTASYCYGFALLLISIVLVFVKLYRGLKRPGKSGGKNKLVFFGLFSISVVTIYSVPLYFVLLSGDEINCSRHAESLVILALFPAIMSLLACSFSVIKIVYRIIRAAFKKKEKRTIVVLIWLNQVMISCCFREIFGIRNTHGDPEFHAYLLRNQRAFSCKERFSFGVGHKGRSWRCRHRHEPSRYQRNDWQRYYRPT